MPSRRRDLVGGNDTMDALVAPLKDHVEAWVRGHPITTAQIGFGAGLHALHTTGLLPYNYYLFHPSLVIKHPYESWRSLTNFLVMGYSFSSIVQRGIAMTLFNADVERRFNGAGDIVRDGQVVAIGEQRLKSNGIPKTKMEWLITDNKYLRYQLLSAAVIVGLELGCYFVGFGSYASNPQVGRYVTAAAGAVAKSSTGYSFMTPESQRTSTSYYSLPPSVLLTYTLFPDLEYSTRWLWALTSSNTNVLLFGVIPLKPMFLPIASCMLGAFSDWKALLKGLACCLLVSKFMNIRRDDGEPVWDWMKRTIKRWMDNRSGTRNRASSFNNNSPSNGRQTSILAQWLRFFSSSSSPISRPNSSPSQEIVVDDWGVGYRLGNILR